MKECIMDFKDLNKEVKNVFGSKYSVINVKKLIGGAQKGTFKVECSMNFNFIMYIWHFSYDNFYKYKDEDIFTSNDAELFKRNSEILRENNISIPEIYYIDISKNKYPFEFAFVQYIDNSDLEGIMNLKGEKHYNIFKDLQDNILKMHNINSRFVGDAKRLKNADFKCEEYIKKIIDKNLEYLYNNFQQINDYKTRIEEQKDKLYYSIIPRKKYSLIHYELGPNHVMVDKNNKVYLIDIEGMKFFDLEMEHSFLKFRFGEFYRYFERKDLDETRMKFYKLYHNVGALAGAHQLLKNNYEDKEDIENMIKYNYHEILKFVES